MLNTISATDAGCSKFIPVMLIIAAVTSMVVGYLLFSPNDLQSGEFQGARLGHFRPHPEYNRQLRGVVVTLAMRDSSLELQHETLTALPDYTRIFLLLPEDNLELLQSELANKTYGDRVELVPYESMCLKNSRVWLLFPEKENLVEVALDETDTDSHDGSVWAQDLFEAMIDSSGRVLLVQPGVNKWYSIAGTDADAKVVPDNNFLRNLRSVGLQTHRAQLAFQGGNILTDEAPDGHRIAFCGSDILATTRTIRGTFGEQRSADEEIIADLRDVLNVDQVVVLTPGRSQPSMMYHLDQAMLLLSDKVVAIPRLVGTLPKASPHTAEIADVERFLAELRAKMLELGYRVVDIETSVRNVPSCQHYVNAIPYTNAQTGQKTVMMPVFRSAQDDQDKLLIARNSAKLESLGYEVVHVPTDADRLRGGIHCLVNVIL